MIVRLLEWFQVYPFLYYAVALTAIFAFIALALRPNNRATETLTLEYALLAAVGLVLLAWRWPTFLWEDPMNPDEGWWPAGAIKATADFAPWRGFDSTTSGPFNAYVLALPALLGARISFFSTRIIGICLITGTIAALYYAVKWTYGARVARLSIVPPVLFLSLARNWNFLHFSSETFPMFLTTIPLAAGAYLAGGAHSKAMRLLACIIAGLCAGSAGFAKLQAVPIALTMVAFVAAGVCFAPGKSRKEKGIETIVASTAFLLVPAAFMVTLWLTGEWDNAIMSFLKRSSHYVTAGRSSGLEFLFQAAPEYTAFLVGSLIVMLTGAIAIVSQRRVSARALWTTGSSVALLLVAVFTIYAARHPFPHYLLFSVVPLSWGVASFLGLLRESSLWERRNGLISFSYLALFLVPSLSIAFSAEPSPFLKEITFNSHWIGSPQAIAIARYARPGSRVAIWGWAPQYYVQTGTIMATRDAETGPQISSNPHQKYFRDRFMSDLRAHIPVVFVDAVAPEPGGYQYHDRATQGHEIFPELGRFISDYYTLKEEVGGVRIFVSKTPQ
jgi:hypothetical protein